MHKNIMPDALNERVTAELNLAEFSPRFEGTVWEVWVNPPLARVRAAAKENDDETRGMAFVGLLLGFTDEEVKRMDDIDAAFLSWLAFRVTQLYDEYANAYKKK